MGATEAAGPGAITERRVVVDASSVVAYLLEEPAKGALRDALIRGDELHIPSLCDIEYASALRRAANADRGDIVRIDERLAAYLALPLRRHAHESLLRRVLELRRLLSAYDATYVALAEMLGAALLTQDRAMARAIQTSREISVTLL